MTIRLGVAVQNPEILPAMAAGRLCRSECGSAWVRVFMCWYNHEYRHSRIRFVTPAERHRGADHQVLARRHALYQQARARHPGRWSGNTRNWEPIGAVMLNPEREQPQLEEAE